jgi:hypothetical protein
MNPMQPTHLDGCCVVDTHLPVVVGKIELTKVETSIRWGGRKKKIIVNFRFTQVSEHF